MPKLIKAKTVIEFFNKDMILFAIFQKTKASRINKKHYITVHIF